ncbi:glycerol dehydratase reactivase beta/small subunit family protein [Clostridium grantii]|uniref:Dehydratase medium subunit n=1 Tax=Clostridium grantii DSM 8605 TaxID=1121316 RepID=A0A1M5SWR3_9CLOT|nr:glycerol dehydratase reactivase beta/small subunit family protein [Clostridium grantii]SHH43021.1 Dehydratase medium subunit [Clostridium grantii DSM 8605]
MYKNKPVINIFTHNCNSQVLKEIFAGIEEEGLPYEISEMVYKDVDRLSYEASTNSSLEVGIGVNEYEVAIHVRQMKKGEYLFEYSGYKLKHMRVLGSNAARYAKKIPFKII